MCSCPNKHARTARTRTRTGAHVDVGVLRIAHRHFMKGNVIKPINKKIDDVKKAMPGNSANIVAAREAAVEAMQAAQSAEHDNAMDRLDGG